LDGIAAIFDHPDVNQNRLVQERGEVGRLWEDIEGLERRLDAITERAAIPELTWVRDEPA